MAEEPDWTDPQCCPYCGSDNLEDRPKDWEQQEDRSIETDREDAIGQRFHGINVCEDCGGRFETVSEPREYVPQNPEFTLQFVPENVDDPDNDAVTGMQAIKLIEAHEEHPSVVSERAKWNMLFGGCGEVQGPEYAIRDLYDFLSAHANIDADEEEFEAGKWLYEGREDEPVQD